MGKSTPGKGDREGIGLVSLLRKFPDDETARAWFEAQVWPGRSPLPPLRQPQRSVRHQAQVHDPPVPRLPQPPHVQSTDRDRHAGLEPRLPDWPSPFIC